MGRPQPSTHQICYSLACFTPTLFSPPFLPLRHAVLVRVTPRRLPIYLPDFFYLIANTCVAFSDTSHIRFDIDWCCSRIWFCGSANYFSNNETTKLSCLVVAHRHSGDLRLLPPYIILSHDIPKTPSTSRAHITLRTATRTSPAAEAANTTQGSRTWPNSALQILIEEPSLITFWTSQSNLMILRMCHQGLPRRSYSPTPHWIRTSVMFMPHQIINM